MQRVLLSVHLTSNRPAKFVQFLDRLEQTTVDFSAVEVVIKIDSDDQPMNELLAAEQKRRPFALKYISTPLVGGFFELWRTYDELLRQTDKSAYFVVSLNDEMYFVDRGWDERLGKYVDLDSDGIYRLRVSMHRERNTFDYWEASCAGELTPLITKKWLDLSGGWCPCNGPDSFQNAVAYYFGWLYRHDTFGRSYREHVAHDILFGAQGSNLDLTDPKALLQRTRGAMTSWYELVSYPMQQEAARRAQVLHAHIWASKHIVGEYYLKDDQTKKALYVFERTNRKHAWSASYKLSRLRIGWTNFVRKFAYPYYCGGGEPLRKMTPELLRYYFLVKYDSTLQELPDLGFSRTGNHLTDSLPYRYAQSIFRVAIALLRR